MAKQSWEKSLDYYVGTNEQEAAKRLRHAQRTKEAQQPVMRDGALNVVSLREVAPVRGLRLPNSGRTKRGTINRAG